MALDALRELTGQWGRTGHVGRRVVAFGASNTEVLWHSRGRHGWVNWLEVALRGYVGRHVTVTNAGVSGDSTEDMLARFERDVLPLSPSLVIVTAGGNDVTQFPCERFTANLAEIVERVRACGAAVVLQTYYSMVTAEAVEAYRDFPAFMQAEADLAARLGAPCIDQHSWFHPWYAADPDAYKGIMLDALHLNPAGNAVMGTLCVRGFGLPDPQLPQDLEAAVADALHRMARHAQLPERIQQ
jgi:lysophospholipase L1-like esterase